VNTGRVSSRRTLPSTPRTGAFTNGESRRLEPSSSVGSAALSPTTTARRADPRRPRRLGTPLPLPRSSDLVARGARPQ
jgi:hypothetical protein